MPSSSLPALALGCLLMSGVASGQTTGASGLALADLPPAAETDQPPGPFRERPRVLASPREHLVGHRLPDLSLTDLDGHTLRLSELAADGALVVALRDVDCPLAKRFGPTLCALEAELAPRGVRFLYLDASAHDTPDEMRRSASELGLAGRWVADPEGRAAARLAARTTTEVLLVDSSLTLRYRGAIDDQYGIGYALAAPSQRYLVDAVSALLAGASPAVLATTAPGCALELEAPDETTEADEAPSWHGQISRLLLDNCVSCHRAGGVGPFVLDDYASASGRSGMIRFVVDNGVMPPWHAEGEPGHWQDDRRLTAGDRALLGAWLDAGCLAGDAAQAPLPRTWPGDWELGSPDLIVENPESYDIPADGVVDYEYSWVATGLTEDTWVEAFEIQPGDRSVVHHALVFLEQPRQPGESQREFNRRSQGGLDGYFASYVPGQGPTIFGDGLAKKLPAGAWLKFQMHYTPNGVATRDRTRIGFRFSDEPPLHEVRTNGVNTRSIDIPPGASSHKIRAGLAFDRESTLLGFSPHMHLRGKAFRFTAYYPDGSTERLLDVPRYDFNWQTMYRLAEPLTVPAGTQLVASAWYDNSADNPANPDPTVGVRFGEQTWDEMMVGFFEWYPAE